MKNRRLRRMFPMFCAALLLTGIIAFAACSEKKDDPADPADTSESFPFQDIKLGDYVKLGAYKNVEAEFHSGEFSEEEIRKEALQYQPPVGIKVDEKKTVAAKGDAVRFDFAGDAEGVSEEVLAELTGTNFVLELGSNSFIEGFEEKMAGKEIDKEFKVNVTFPTNYGQAELAGKPAVFTCTIHAIGSPVRVTEYIANWKKSDGASASDADAAIAEWTQGYLNSFSEFMEYVEMDLQANASGNNVMLAFNTAESNAEITVPEGEKNYYVDLLTQSASNYGLTVEQYLEYNQLGDLESYRSNENDVQIRKDLFAFAVAEQEGIEITQDNIQAFLDYVRENNASDLSDEELIEQYGYDLMLRSIMNELVAKFIYENAAGVTPEAETEA